MSATMFRTAATSSSAEHKPILAERFKTKMCQNYETKGACPYEARCMFAHGPADLRTKHMNLADNLVTEDAIKAFLNSKQTASRDAADGKNSILAERFKTKMCQNHEKQGSCPYEARCMFAHGAADLRTKEMNLADNLVTEEAIRAFQKRGAAAKKAYSAALPPKKPTVEVAVAAPVSLSKTEAVLRAIAASSPVSSEAPSTPSGSLASFEAFPAARTSSEYLTVSRDSVETPRRSSCAPQTSRKRHNPYAPVAFGPMAASVPAWTAYLAELEDQAVRAADVSPLASAMRASPAKSVPMIVDAPRVHTVLLA